jgi:hypothetical protein
MQMQAGVQANVLEMPVSHEMGACHRPSCIWVVKISGCTLISFLAFADIGLSNLEVSAVMQQTWMVIFEEPNRLCPQSLFQREQVTEHFEM